MTKPKFTDREGQDLTDAGGKAYGKVGPFIQHEKGRDFYEALIPDELVHPKARHQTPYVAFDEEGHRGGGYL